MSFRIGNQSMPGLAITVVVALFAAAPRLSAAQITTVGIDGVVEDETGAVLPGVTVTATHLETGTTRTVTTDHGGRYTLVNLRVGEYELRTELAGFETQLRRGVRLTVGQQVAIDITMHVGELEDVISVVGEAPVINTTQATISGTVDERRIRELPLNARDLMSLAPLFTGAAFADTGEQSPSKGFGTKLSIAGTRYNANIFLLDGTDIRDTPGAAGSASGMLMGVETVREFSVVTNAFSAEYGNHTGGVFNALTKSGTNNLRGSGFWFHRNDSFDARNFFDVERPDFERNQFGATLGGPLMHDRLFFFASYEALREGLGLTQRFTVPTAAARAGQLPGRAPVPVHPEVRKWLDAYPLPNGDDFGDGRAEYIRVGEQTINQDFITARADYRINDRSSFFGRYTWDDAIKSDPQFSFLLDSLTTNQYLTLENTHIFSASAVNRFMAAATRTDIRTETPLFPGVILPSLTFTGRQPNGQIGIVGIGGLTSLGGSNTNPRSYPQNTFQFKDDVTVVRGNHSLKMGGEFQRYQITHAEPFHGAGEFTFRSLNEAYAGLVDRFQALFPQTEVPFYHRQSYFGSYIQDDIRLRSNLTLNLGLRYEFLTTPTEKYGRLANARDYVTPGLTIDDMVIGDPYYDNPSYKSFGPRVGIVWSPGSEGKTSIRGGAGIYYDHIRVGLWTFGFSSQPPFFVRGDVRARDVAPRRLSFPDAYFTQSNLLGALLSTEGIVFDAKQPTVYKWALEMQHEILPNTRLEVGYTATRGVNMMRVDTINDSWPLQVLENGRIYVPPGTGTLHPAMGRVRPRFTDGESDYHAFTLGVNRRFSGGLQFQSSYTVSKILTDFDNWTGSSDWGNAGSNSQSKYNVPPFLFQKLDRGLAFFDMRQNFAFNATWELPIGHGRAFQPSGLAGHLLGGWALSTIVRLNSGNPFTPSEGTGVFPIARGRGLDLVPGASSNPIDPRNPIRYFDPSSFTLPFDPANRREPGIGLIGNLGRNTIIGPGIATLDLMVGKDFAAGRLSAESRIQFRAELFNLLNRANFAIPSGTAIFNPDGSVRADVGRITRTRTSARQLQLGLRVVW